MLFVLDILIAFRTTYFDPHSGAEIFSAKKTAIVYLKSQFLIDAASAVPLDTIYETFFKTKNENLALFSMFKLIRVSRLSRMISRLNVDRGKKHIMKLTQLIFYLVMYLHVLGCVWFWIVGSD